MNRFHWGRAWTGHAIEDACPCDQARPLSALYPTEDEKEALDFAIRGPIADLNVNYRPLWRLIKTIQVSVLAAGFRRAPADPAVQGDAKLPQNSEPDDPAPAAEARVGVRAVRPAGDAMIRKNHPRAARKRA